MNLLAGGHYMQLSKRLGHSTFVLTLTTYADYINEDEMAAPKVGRGVADGSNVVDLKSTEDRHGLDPTDSTRIST